LTPKVLYDVKIGFTIPRFFVGVFWERALFRIVD